MGVEYNEGEPTVFNTLTFSVEGIDEWVGISGFEFVPQFESCNSTLQPYRISATNGCFTQP